MQHNHSGFRLGADSSASPALPSSDPVTAVSVALVDARPKGTFFESGLDLRNPEGDTFSNEVFAVLALSEERKRKRVKMAEIAYRMVVRKILANGLRCHFYRQPALVAYWRKADAYFNEPTWLSGRAMSRAIDRLVRVGLLINSVGERGTASTYQLSEELVAIARRHDVTENSLTFRLPSESLVRLRQAVTKSPLPFNPTAETQRWSGLLEAQNAFLAQHDITLATTAEQDAEWVRHLNAEKDDDLPVYTRPERYRTDHHRTFNNGTFEHGGRLYAPWWQNMPKSFRQDIRIDGQPTVELDFSGCAIRMLYHDRKIDYQDDPYYLAAIAEYEAKLGEKPKHFREAIKAIVQALLNATDGPCPEQIKLPDGVSFGRGYKRAAIRKMIEEKHRPIAGAFGTGEGLRLQRKDSDLALTIITALRRRNIVALPIHDSFIVVSAAERELFDEMKRSYEAAFVFSPVIRKQPKDHLEVFI